jgi:hypothetical protein
MRLKITILFLVSLMIIFSSFADTIVLKSGKTIDAKIIERTDEKIKIDVEGIGITYFLSDIVSINGQNLGQGTPTGNSLQSLATPETTPIENLSGASATPVMPEVSTPAETLAPETAQPKLPQTTSKENVATTTDENTSAAITEKPQSSVKDNSAADVKKADSVNTNAFAPSAQQSDSTQPTANKYARAYPSKRFPLSGKGSEAAMAAFILGFMGIFYAIILAMLIFSALCLYLIAKKTNTEPAWLAWIPIAHNFLMCKIAGLSYWWLLIMLAFFIPFLGGFIALGCFIFVYYKIAIARGKPGWIAFLLLIPLIGPFIVGGYLAFAE